jgi:hypothetical protein
MYIRRVKYKKVYKVVLSFCTSHCTACTEKYFSVQLIAAAAADRRSHTILRSEGGTRTYAKDCLISDAPFPHRNSLALVLCGMCRLMTQPPCVKIFWPGIDGTFSKFCAARYVVKYGEALCHVLQLGMGV